MSFAVYLAFLAATAAIFQHHVPLPYMDEIFHIPQAQQYCQNRFDIWDPMITTPPGLYLASRILVTLPWFACDTRTLRATNLVFASAIYAVLAQLIKLHHPTVPASARQLYTLALACFPVLSFFYFLYYTDAGSTLFVLATYLRVKQRHYLSAGLFGIVSLLFRQTNVIWVVFCTALAAMDILQARGKLQPVLYKDVTTPFQAIKVMLEFVAAALKDLPTLCCQLSVFVSAILGFAAFLVWNQGIVLGDKSNHVAGLHFPQLMYLSSFISFFAGPWILEFPLGYPSIKWIIASTIVMAYFAWNHTYEHPFLLSDNRHYTFYIWRKIYKLHASARYLLIPAYYVSGEYLFVSLLSGRNVSFLFALGFYMAALLTLVPSPLLEFRYYIIPFLFYCIQLGPPADTRRTTLVLAMYFALHLVTVYLFIYRPFEWPSEPGMKQRFMW
ncbi:alpha-2-glucosyltransferase Alg10 [Syncephalastrum racemosum]|uniref:Dol-P-Glc:Glc(2)Man(9)GlcNAc(2)-PP-Dol alpha-1,2-glucosyltransferase n=1 Tax=Syncephalastrum racemosum TaxID=13706 RepID=A0A1X2HS91_SYNRA|nr:alpha-2-glucosyltransferase Alg10 [Syncephalastrum racemosum]